MSFEEFILRVRACIGIGLATEFKIYQFIKQNKRVPNLNDFIQIMDGKYAIASDAYMRIFSKKTTELLQQTLAFSKYITIFDQAYPAKLREIYHPPLVLFYRGNLELLQRKALAVVGARQHSSYSHEVLQGLLPPIVQNKIITISGLAQGVDSLCHRLTINSGGHTVGVIGTGMNRVYPRCNQELQYEMMQNHLVISEYVYDEEPRAWHFPERNRIIAGLCDSLMVTEAKERSGSLITANLALQENRNVLAVPGKINAALSRGCNLLIREGAKPVLESQDILEEFLIQ